MPFDAKFMSRSASALPFLLLIGCGPQLIVTSFATPSIIGSKLQDGFYISAYRQGQTQSFSIIHFAGNQAIYESIIHYDSNFIPYVGNRFFQTYFSRREDGTFRLNDRTLEYKLDRNRLVATIPLGERFTQSETFIRVDTVPRFFHIVRNRALEFAGAIDFTQTLADSLGLSNCKQYYDSIYVTSGLSERATHEDFASFSQAYYNFYNRELARAKK